MDDATAELIRKLEKDVLLLQRKLDRSEMRREEVEQLMAQTQQLLKRVTDERLTEEERHRLEVFRKFVPADFLLSLGRERFEDIQLGDSTEREMTILFSDIRNFTSLSESLSPKETFDFLNSYLNHIEPAIINNEGFIDKFIGDAILALFYKPSDAIQAGIEMGKRLSTFDRERALNLHIGIGIHTGSCMMGIIGGKDRMEGTVISDAVNLAARLESLTKLFHSALLVSDFTLQSSTNRGDYETRFLGKVRVMGRTKAVSIYEILDAEQADIAEQKRRNKQSLDEAIKLFYRQQFSEAEDKFIAILDTYQEDVIAHYYLDEVHHARNEAPSTEWEGILTMAEK
jgi:class 3 adenylate cyclase